MIQPVIELFEAHHIPVLDVSELLRGRDPATTVVNTVDSHPNEAVHRQVAEQLYRLLNDQCQQAGCQKVVIH